MNAYQKNPLRHEGFVRGFIVASAFKNLHETLLALEEAECAWDVETEERLRREEVEDVRTQKAKP